MTVSLHNRRKLEEAMRRLLDGSATTADGKLTWKNVAAVSGVSKATADRAVDLRDEFRQQLQQRTPSPSARADPVSPPRDELEQELARVRQENTDLKHSTKVLHSVILALTHENQRLARRRRRADADVVSLATGDQKPEGKALIDDHDLARSPLIDARDLAGPPSPPRGRPTRCATRRATRRQALPTIANACPKQATRSRRLQVACAGAAASRSLRAPVPRRATAASAADRPPRAPGLRSRAGRPRPGGERADVDHSKRHVARRVAPQRSQLTAGPLSRSTPAPRRFPALAVPRHRRQSRSNACLARIVCASGGRGRPPQRSQTRSPPDSTAPSSPR